MKHSTLRTGFLFLVAAILFSAGADTHARRSRAVTTPSGGTDVADTPMAALPPVSIMPNILIVFDDSGSMDLQYLPDEGSVFFTDPAPPAPLPAPPYGRNSNHCNSIYYDPSVVYLPPPKADGSGPMATSSFTAAPINGFSMSYNMALDPVNLSTAFDLLASSSSGISTDRKQPAFYNVYTGTYVAESQQNFGGSGPFLQECQSATGALPGRSVFTKVVVSATSGPGRTDERTNFANWYTYYRTRLLAMKSATARAFMPVGSNVRVGYFTISHQAYPDMSTFVKIADFSGTSKINIFNALYKTKGFSSTPLRAALSRAGLMYAGKELTGADDPVQYSCQRNYAILSTDGQWNESLETGTYTPKKIDGTPIGNEDVLLPRPMQDGTYVAAARSTIQLSLTGSTTVSSIRVNGTELMSRPTRAFTDPVDLGPSLAALITQNGYTATYSATRLTITAPTALGAITDTPVITKAGPISLVATAFATPAPTAGGAANTLADVTAYYYNTDLRDKDLFDNCTGALGTDVCANNVPGSATDNNPKQHMTTYTIGFGVKGVLQYDANYDKASSGDFFDIKQGTKQWPNPISSTIARNDDLWHAAVNGHGKYFSAKNPDAVISGLNEALAAIGISERTGAAAAAATSNLEPVAGDNYVYVALYRSAKWDGDLHAKTINPTTGDLSTTDIWAAQPLLDDRVSASSDTRTIYTFDNSNTSTTNLKPFLWSNLTDSEKANFTSLCGGTPDLTQCADLTTDQKTSLEGANLVNFIRGQYGFEDRTTNPNPLYRGREHVLGDIVSSQPVYVKKPPFKYSDQNYGAFRDAKATRQSMVYVAANDGMLHAFNGDTGVEEWAYIPPAVFPNLYKLADTSYADKHRYLVDGTPTIGDICPKAPGASCTASEWKTILVGGLNNGGRAYYALDITNPASPKALWNFTNRDLGYTFGNPIITKRANGAWVVVFASGYNNIVGEDEDDNADTLGRGDGKGYLYVLNANTGASLEKIGTGVGNHTAPSGLAKINVWVDSVTDNTAKRFYGGDLMGNVWRFDIDDLVPPSGKEAVKLAELGDTASGGIGVQSITTKPELTEIRTGTRTFAVVHVATGRYLGETDLTSTAQQSIYAIKDSLTATGVGRVRTAAAGLVRQTLIPKDSGKKRTTSTNPVDWNTNNGWYVDLNPDGTSPGERVNVDMQQQLGLLTVVANVPERNSCTVGGYAWLYHFDFRTGQFVPTAPLATEGAGSNDRTAGERRDAMASGEKTIRTDDGRTSTVIVNADGTVTVKGDPFSNPEAGAGAKRISWRELTE